MVLKWIIFIVFKGVKIYNLKGIEGLKNMYKYW